MVVGALTAFVTACSTDQDDFDSVLWRQLDAAENQMYRVLTAPDRSVGTPAVLFERLSTVLAYWDGKAAPATFSEERGMAIFYSYREEAGSKQASFEMFVASGRIENPTGKRVFTAEAKQVYTCYRIDVSFKNGAVDGFFRGSDSDEHRLECPQELRGALGEGAEYREPWMFDG